MLPFMRVLPSVVGKSPDPSNLIVKPVAESLVQVAAGVKLQV
jgi:hypothetical protein